MTAAVRVAAMATGLTLALSLVVASPQQSAAATGTWDPGYIVSDQQFYDGNAMSAAEIQSFLEAKVPVCQPERSAGPNDPIVCLKDYRLTTVTRPADAFCPGTYVGAQNERASTIIFKVSQACNINPKVLLVTLQKEMALVTHTWPSQWRYDKALGYACSDSAPCNSALAGFQTQIWSAARQFQRYRLEPTRYGHLAGITNLVRFHPNAACGTSPVLIKNAATAGLYNYTPYQPNAKAIAAGYGQVLPTPNCSSYGNRNFWRYWSDWFGDPRATGALVNVTANERVSGANRYATAAAISATFAADADVVYVASGENYPDALAIAPIAASSGAALLLVRRDSLPNEIIAELTRLKPKRIVVVGGTGAISAKVYDSLSGYAGAGGISRLGGLDRYETGRIVVGDHWVGTSTSLVYVASGRNFPDALSSAAAAGAQDAPVISIDGSAARLDAASATLIAELGATEIVIAGGTGVISTAIQNDLAAIAGVTEVRRAAGANRYSTSAAINTGAFASASQVYLAYGQNFPDALAGAVRAGVDGAPLYIVPGSCVPREIADSINRYGPIKVTLVGGAGVLPLKLSTAPVCK